MDCYNGFVDNIPRFRYAQSAVSVSQLEELLVRGKVIGGLSRVGVHYLSARRDKIR